MNNLYAVLDFDSEMFGYGVAKLDQKIRQDQIQGVLNTLKSNNIRLVYWFVDSFDVERNQAARKFGGILVDEKITYVFCKRVKKYYPPEIRNVRSYPHKSLREPLVSLALQSGMYSRFKRDRYFTHGEYKKLFITWIRKSVSREIAIDVLVYTDMNKIIRGMISLESQGANGRIGLFAVDGKFRGQSIGTFLATKAIMNFQAAGYKTILVTTQKKNTIACMFYERFGFTKKKTIYVYHFWL